MGKNEELCLGLFVLQVSVEHPRGLTQQKIGYSTLKFSGQFWARTQIKNH